MRTRAPVRNMKNIIGSLKSNKKVRQSHIASPLKLLLGWLKFAEIVYFLLSNRLVLMY